jgi:hypothetical protein
VTLPPCWSRPREVQGPLLLRKLTGPTAVKLASVNRMPGVVPPILQVLLLMVVAPSSVTAVPAPASMDGTAKELVKKVLSLNQALAPVPLTSLMMDKELVLLRILRRVQVTPTASSRP